VELPTGTVTLANSAIGITVTRTAFDWKAAGFVVGQPGNYPNPQEMFAYFGQWYLAGFGSLIREREPEVYALCEQFLGKARVSPEGITAREAAISIDHLLKSFKTGLQP